MTDALIKRRNWDMTHTFREGELCKETSRCHTKMEAMLPQTKENLRLPEAKKMQGRVSLQVAEGGRHCQNAVLGLLAKL